MEQFLSQLARQSLTAGWMILALLVLRPLLKKVPRSFSCLLWALVAVRLVTPFSFQSRVSLVPQSIAAPTRITPILPDLSVSALEQPTVQAAAPVRGIAWGQVLTVIWLMGVAAMAVYALVSYIRLINRVRVSIRIQDRLYLCDNVRSPFVLGMFRPRIYLPSDMEPQTTTFVLAHEQAHLRRGDHLWKPLGYAILCIHWFNPLCWLAYILFCRDMEQACDEAVIRNMSTGDKKAYSAALLKCSLPRSAIAACPLAFGELSVKQRIRGVLNYRKPKFWVVAVSAVLCVVLAACFLTDPVKANNVEAGENDSSDLQEFPVYSSPSKDARSVYQLVPGEDYTILRTEPIGQNLWGYVECQDGKTRGWLLLGTEETSFFQIDGATPLAAGTVIGPKHLNVRSGPGVDYPEVSSLTPGSEVPIYEVVTSDDLQWGLIGSDMWVCMNYIRVNEASTPTIPSIVETEKYNIFAKQTKLYFSPSLKSREVGQGEADEVYTLYRVEYIADSVWGYIQCQKDNVFGWILLDAEEVGLLQISESVVPTVKPEGEFLTFPQETAVYSDPDTDSRVLARYSAGVPVSIDRRELIGNSIWGVVKYQDGETLGWILLGEEEADNSNELEATQQSGPSELEEEFYTFTREADIHSMPAEAARTLRQTAVGEECTVLRREFVNGGSWGFAQFPSDDAQGWVHFVEDDEALAYFREYVDSCSQPAPDAAESYLYFASDYAREFFRENYAPVTGWYPSGIFRVNENLWGILFTDSAEGRSVYCFVGRMDDRLYVFQNVHQVPEQLSENLDVASYEEENAMYLSDGYMECSWVIKRLLEFANPVKVEIQEDGTGKYAGGSMSYEDMLCCTDTWRVIREIPDAEAHCTITLYASDGSTARFWDVDGSVLVTYPDGSQACYRADFNGEEIISMLYDWAKERA